MINMADRKAGPQADPRIAMNRFPEGAPRRETRARDPTLSGRRDPATIRAGMSLPQQFKGGRKILTRHRPTSAVPGKTSEYRRGQHPEAEREASLDIILKVDRRRHSRGVAASAKVPRGSWGAAEPDHSRRKAGLPRANAAKMPSAWLTFQLAEVGEGDETRPARQARVRTAT